MNRTAVITGATSGIGQAIAYEFHKSNINLVLTGRQEDKLQKIAQETNAEYICCDVLEPSLPKQLLELAVKKFGSCDILINNAGNIKVGTIEEIDVDHVCNMVRVNVEAAYRMAYVFLKHFKQQNNGHLINMSSIMGTKVRPTAGAYAGTKFAIEALSEALRMELSKTNVQITCVEPGLVKTELHRNWETHPTESMDIPNPLTPQDIANTVMYVISQKEHIRIPKILVLPKDHVI